MPDTDAVTFPEIPSFLLRSNETPEQAAAREAALASAKPLFEKKPWKLGEHQRHAVRRFPIKGMARDKLAVMIAAEVSAGATAFRLLKEKFLGTYVDNVQVTENVLWSGIYRAKGLRLIESVHRRYQRI